MHLLYKSEDSYSSTNGKICLAMIKIDSKILKFYKYYI
jgi:hypothetical protein